MKESGENMSFSEINSMLKNQFFTRRTNFDIEPCPLKGETLPETLLLFRYVCHSSLLLRTATATLLQLHRCSRHTDEGSNHFN
jgi:hypothetical protein